MFTSPRIGIVNVKMVITEEKILSNIDKIHRLIDPNSKRQIIELEDDAYFKDLVESIKTYLIEYPKKKNFPKSIYDAAYNLVEYATNLFEENTKQIESLMKQREYNIKTAAILKQTFAIVQSGDAEWKKEVNEVSDRLSNDVIQALYIVGNSSNQQNPQYQAAIKLINAKIANLQSNLHIEIDLERIEDRSKALSYIGIEIADALKLIPVPANNVVNNESQQASQVVTNTNSNLVNANNKQRQVQQNTVVVETIDDKKIQDSAYQDYYAETTREVKDSLWHRFTHSKFIRAIKYAFRIRIRLQLPEGMNEDNNNK